MIKGKLKLVSQILFTHYKSDTSYGGKFKILWTPGSTAKAIQNGKNPVWIIIAVNPDCLVTSGFTALMIQKWLNMAA